ncbi:MAG: hypothetical protein IRY91_12815, partial [Gemmatimonadaceae bacterium]|nr:hypothetical protein [Gemmatimonadaceae bacterium]
PPPSPRQLDADVALLFAPVTLAGDGITSDADDAPFRTASDESSRRSQPAYVYRIPFWHRKSVRYRTFAILFLAAATAGAFRVRAIRKQQALERASEAAVRTPPASLVAPGGERLALSAAAGEVTGVSREAASRFARSTIEQSTAALGAVLTDIDAALADARDPRTHAAACARAESAYVKALVNADAIALARRQLLQPLDSTPLARVQALTKQADDVAPRLRAACR